MRRKKSQPRPIAPAIPSIPSSSANPHHTHLPPVLRPTTKLLPHQQQHHTHQHHQHTTAAVTGTTGITGTTGAAGVVGTGAGAAGSVLVRPLPLNVFGGGAHLATLPPRPRHPPPPLPPPIRADVIGGSGIGGVGGVGGVGGSGLAPGKLRPTAKFIVVSRMGSTAPMQAGPTGVVNVQVHTCTYVYAGTLYWY